LRTKITFANLTDVGLVRQHNEDRAIVCHPGDELGSVLGYLIALADGMGGHASGEIAAGMAVRELAHQFYCQEENAEDTGAILLRIFQAVNDVIYREAQKNPKQIDMGTTLVCAVIKDDHLWVANVGDSRAYLIRGGDVFRLTRDHSWVEEKGLNESEAQATPFKNVVTRGVGTSPKVEVDVFTEVLLPRDIVLLCSDGLTRHVESQTIARSMRRVKNLRRACASLVQTAKRNGGTDNITVVAAHMIKVKKRKEPHAVKIAFPAHRVASRKVRRSRRNRIVAGVLTLISIVAIYLGFVRSNWWMNELVKDPAVKTTTERNTGEKDLRSSAMSTFEVKESKAQIAERIRDPASLQSKEPGFARDTSDHNESLDTTQSAKSTKSNVGVQSRRPSSLLAKIKQPNATIPSDLPRSPQAQTKNSKMSLSEREKRTSGNVQGVIKRASPSQSIDSFRSGSTGRSGKIAPLPGQGNLHRHDSTRSAQKDSVK